MLNISAIGFYLDGLVSMFLEFREALPLDGMMSQLYHLLYLMDEVANLLIRQMVILYVCFI